VESSKYKNDKRDWLVSAIIGIRKDVLIALRKKIDGLDREIYTYAERCAISQEITEIAEMVSEKDTVMKKLVQLEDAKKVSSRESCLIDRHRIEIIKMLKDMRKNFLAIEYSGEYAVVDKELREIEDMIKEKDRLINTKVPVCYSGGKSDKRKNIYLNKFFTMDNGQNI